MVYANDEWVQVPVMLLYDTGLMQSAINNARHMYEKAEKRLDDFYEKYDNFITPIQRDQDWYNENVIGKFRKGIDELYARGEDPLRTATGRAKLAALARSIDVGAVNKLRTSADNAREFLKERSRLEAAGLYNPLLAKYDGPDINSYSTLESGAWDKMSPTPYRNMADFTKSFFDNIAPFERAATKNGISYSISEISPQDLYNIAEAHYNDLVSTPQGQLMYKMYKDQLGSDEAAKKAFNDAVVAGNLDRLRYSDNYNEMLVQADNLNLKRQSLAIQRQNLALKRQIAAAKARNDNGGPGTQLEGVSLARSWYDTAMAKAWSADGITKDWWNMGNNYGKFGDEVSKVFHDFGKSQSYKATASKSQLLNTSVGKGKQGKALEYALSLPESKRNASQKSIVNAAYKELGVDNSPSRFSNMQESYRRQFSIPMDGQAVAKIFGTPLSDNNRVAKLAPGMVNKLYGTDDIISNTAGYTKTHTTKSTRAIRDAIKKYGISNTTISALEEGYGSLRKNTGSFEVMPRVRVTCTDNDGNIVFQQDAYGDISLGSERTKGGAYYGDYKERGGAKLTGSMVETSIPRNFGTYVPNPNENAEEAIYVPGFRGLVGNTTNLNWTPSQSAKSYNMFPDYNRWTGFGVWDTDLTSSRLHAGQSEKLGTYGNPYEVYDDEDALLNDIITND